ncbi:Cof subfamily protein (haloacid dehalogenase superfamily) [Breznakia sp. PF5-3]|uniref:HAD family hydrolase n=1 Tax=unclassified Breznakia TaxID=2623764 RepID=UPI002404A958|nr:MULTISPECIES: HAD family hydrolase [unclassified Breznakia]MDF9824303.1 Cof subfamily protein (haloacid dehalogenase superfamily) [Breznakia sp. PM6-1]MDF9835527.1 Cof subfamily protein (haloacid dehalogenase superfamily) [Breznakia sp. PF5-3]MDF9838794.1 Cof subfamily protein (haloacid dehalogenase superfamily) [Breznakia sp. PFB2-8]MDF9860818.1 Cof subfamily protein (haloacid dehalogenase superfamily) [Breznakia sp. PH5-24]
MIKLVLCDMDGTLLHDDKSLPKDIYEIYRKLLDKNVYCGIATGRSLLSIQRDFASLKDELIFIIENGAAAYYKGEVLYRTIMDKKFIHKVIDESQKINDIQLILAGETQTYCEACSEEELELFKIYYPKIQVVESLYDVDADIMKMTVFNKRNQAEENYPFFLQFKEQANIITSGKEWIDISVLGANKGKGVKVIQEKFHLKKEECMAFGDYMNDYEMMLNVGASYAMGNGHPKIKEISKHIIGTNEEEAVLQTLRKEFKLED